MGEKITSINPEMLKWARQSSGAILEEVESKLGLQNKISLWEQGVDYPTYSQLKKICEIYRKPIAVCFFPKPPQLKNIPSSCRTLPDNIHNKFSQSLIKLIDDARVMQLNLSELNNSTNPSLIKITNIKFNSGDSKSVSADLRKLMNADLLVQKKIKKLEDAFEYWRDNFYQVGIYVFKNAFQDDTVSGFCLYDFEFPIIYINNSFSPARQIFTLFHELFHLINQTCGIDFLNDDFLNYYDNKTNVNIERMCNQFAGQFLVPDEDFDLLIKNKKPSDEFISELSNIYSVSREVILRKFLDRHLITDVEYHEKSDKYNSDYFRAKKENVKPQGDYYNTQAIYKGKHYLKLTYNNYYENKISITQLAGYLNMKIPSVEKLALRKGWGIL